jgi:hypothetical protein
MTEYPRRRQTSVQPPEDITRGLFGWGLNIVRSYPLTTDPGQVEKAGNIRLLFLQHNTLLKVSHGGTTWLIRGLACLESRRASPRWSCASVTPDVPVRKRQLLGRCSLDIHSG